jgi:hypothetical protein
MMRLVQLQNGPLRRVALVEEPRLHLLADVISIYELAGHALRTGGSLHRLVEEKAAGDYLDYDAVYAGRSPWRLLPAGDHPLDPAHCLVTGTGLTHLGSAKNRQQMHAAATPGAELNDSMKMFRWGVEHGRPPAGQIGIAPEWFYKGDGSVLRAHGQPLDVPPYAEDGGEEAELAGVYMIGPDSQPHRLGMAIGNEFSDHKFEKRNYLNLAGSKLRNCALGPELVLDPGFASVPGTVTIERDGQTIWTQEICTGEQEMCHSLANLEHHHFKFEGHRRPGTLHVHFYGACSLSFGAGLELANADTMAINFTGFGRPLRNPLRILPRSQILTTVNPLT